MSSAAENLENSSYLDLVTDTPLAVRQTTDVRQPPTIRIPRPFYTVAGPHVNEDNINIVPTAFACMRYLSTTVANLTWNVKRKVSEGFEVAERVPVQRLINKRPSSEYSSYQFRETMLYWALRYGNGYAEIERDSVGRPVALHPIHPTRVTVWRDLETNELYYEVTNPLSARIDFDMEDIFHLKGFGESPVGLNIAAYAAETIGWARAAQTFGAGFFGNGANPSGIVKVKKRLTEDGLRGVREEFRATYSGKNAAGVAVLDNDMDFSPLSIEPDKGQFIETNSYLVTEICRWFGVPPHKVGHLENATFCLPAGAVVATEYGPKKIVQIREGQRVWSVNPETSKLELKPVTAFGYSGKSEVLTIKTRGRTLRCTANHRVLVRREFMDAEKQGRGPYTVIDGVKHQKNWRNEYIEAGDLRIGDQLIAVDELGSDGGDLNSPFGNATERMMEVFGYLIGDGFHSRGYKSRIYSFGFSHGENDPCAEYYIQSTTEEFGIEPHVRDKNTTMFYSREVSEMMDSAGLFGTAKTKRVPAWVFTQPREMQLAFLRGYLDSDGTVNKQNQVRFVSANSDLLEDIRQLCMCVGIRCGEVFGYMRKSSFDGYEETSSMLYGLICSAIEQIFELGSNCPNRQKRLQEGYNTRRTRKAPMYDSERLRRDAGEGLRATSITSIEISEDVEDTYDLTVEGNHCFVADGVVVHNSNIEHQAIEVVTDTLMPWVRRFTDEADYKLLSRNGAMETAMDLTTLLRGDTAARMAYYKTLREIGAISSNEVRAAEGMNTIGEDGDKYVIQSQYTTLEQIGEEPEPEPEPIELEPVEEPEGEDDEPVEPTPIEESEDVAAARNRVLTWAAANSGTGGGGTGEPTEPLVVA